MAAPAAAARNRRAGRPRPVVRRHHDRLPLMAGRWGGDGRRKPPRRRPMKPAASPQRKYGAGDRKAVTWSAAGRVRLTGRTPRRKARTTWLAPRGAPRPSHLARDKGRPACPGPRKTTRAMALALVQARAV